MVNTGPWISQSLKYQHLLIETDFVDTDMLDNARGKRRLQGTVCMVWCCHVNIFAAEDIELCLLAVLLMDEHAVG